MSMQETIARLQAGGIGIVPTDTLYGLVARALDENAVQRVYATKGRAPEKPCIVLIADIADLSLFGITIDQLTSQLLGRLWPGPISIVLPCDKPELTYLHRGTKTLAFRLPADDEFRAFLRETGPLIAPSANPEGKSPATTIAEARTYFGEMVDSYQEAGILSGAPSTLVTIEEGKIRILREGSVTIPDEIRLY